MSTCKARAKEAELRATAEAERDAKEEARAALEGALRRSEGTRLLAQSRFQLDRNPSLALLLAVQSARRHPSVLANATLLETMEVSPRHELVLEDRDTTAATFSPDAHKVVTGHADGKLRIRDAGTGELLHTLEGHAEKIWYVGWLRATGKIVSRSVRSVRIWNPDGGEELVNYPMELSNGTFFVGNTESVCLVYRWGKKDLVDLVSGNIVLELPRKHRFEAVSADGSHAIVHSWDRGPDELELWDLREKTKLHAWPTCANPKASFSPDGATVLVTSEDTQVGLVDVASGSLLHRFTSRDPLSGELAVGANAGHDVKFEFTRDGAKAVTVIDTIVSVRDLVSGRTLYTLDVKAIRSPRVESFRISEDGRRFALAVQGRPHPGIEMFDLETGERLYTLRKAWDRPGLLEMSADGGEILTLDDGTVRVWDPVPGGERLRMRSRCGNASLIPSPDGRHVATAPWGSEPPKVWDLETRRPVQVLHHHAGRMNNRFMWMTSAAAFSPDGKRLASAGFFAGVVVWNPLTGARVRSLRERYPWPDRAGMLVRSVAFGPEGRQLVTAGFDRVARVWDIERGEVVLRLGKGSQERLEWNFFSAEASFSPDGRQILTRLEPRSVRVWARPSGDLLHTLAGHEDDLKHTTYSPDSRLIATSTRATTRIWSAGTGAVLHVLEGSVRTCSAFRRDGGSVVTAGEGEVTLWDVESGARLRSFPAGEGRVHYATLSPDGSHVLGVRQGTLLVWETDTGARVLELGGVVLRVGMMPPAEFTRDSGSVMVIDRVGELRVIPLAVLEAAEAAAPRPLTPEERALYLPGEAASGSGDVRVPPQRVVAKTAATDAEHAVKQALAALETAFLKIFPDPDRRRDAMAQVRDEYLRLGIPSNLTPPLCTLASRLKHEERFDEEESVLREALRWSEGRLGSEHGSTDSVLHLLARQLIKTEKYADAEPLARRLVAKGPSHFSDEALGLLAESLAGQGKHGAECEDVLRKRVALSGPDDSRRLLYLRLLGTCLVEQGRYEEAERLLLEAYEGDPKSKPLTAAAIVRLYEAWGKPERLADWRARTDPETDASGAETPPPARP